MRTVESHTLEEHRDYLYQIVRLQLFFLQRWLKEHPDENFRDAIRNRIDIYRKTNANPQGLNPTECLFDMPDWKTMEDEAEILYRKYKGDGQMFEDQAFLVFRPSLDARCERDYLDDSRLAAYQCGSLRYETSLQADGKTVGFHIANAVSPRSIFDDPAYLPNCFIQLMDETEEKYRAERISTSTWLNSMPRWLELFPQEWMDNMSAANKNVQWHYGFWGQFISARHTFNRKYGDILRRTGELPYYPKASSCSIQTMRKHLKRFVS